MTVGATVPSGPPTVFRPIKGQYLQYDVREVQPANEDGHVVVWFIDGSWMCSCGYGHLLNYR